MVIQDIIQTQSRDGKFNHTNVSQHQQLSVCRPVRRLLCTHAERLRSCLFHNACLAEGEWSFFLSIIFFLFFSFFFSFFSPTAADHWLFVAVFSLLSLRVCSVGSGPWEKEPPLNPQPSLALDILTTIIYIYMYIYSKHPI